MISSTPQPVHAGPGANSASPRCIFPHEWGRDLTSAICGAGNTADRALTAPDASAIVPADFKAQSSQGLGSRDCTALGSLALSPTGLLTQESGAAAFSAQSANALVAPPTAQPDQGSNSQAYTAQLPRTLVAKVTRSRKIRLLITAKVHTRFQCLCNCAFRSHGAAGSDIRCPCLHRSVSGLQCPSTAGYPALVACAFASRAPAQPDQLSGSKRQTAQVPCAPAIMTQGHEAQEGQAASARPLVPFTLHLQVP